MDYRVKRAVIVAGIVSLFIFFFFPCGTEQHVAVMEYSESNLEQFLAF